MSLSGNTAALLAAVTVVASSFGPAKAQDWREYAYPEAGFSAQFPSPPAVRAFTYRTAAGQAAPARMWTAHLGAADYGVTVVDFSNTGVVASAAIEAAVKQVAGVSRVKLDVTERIDRQFGRELSIVGADGGQTAAAIFFVDGKLYILAGTAAAASAEAIFPLTVRFQQSLQFIDREGKPPRRPEDGQGLGPPDGAAGEGGRPDRRRPPPQAFTDCRGRSEGEAVRHRTPGGDVVAATCIQTPDGLAARPDTPLGGPPPEG